MENLIIFCNLLLFIGITGFSIKNRVWPLTIIHIGVVINLANLLFNGTAEDKVVIAIGLSTIDVVGIILLGIYKLYEFYALKQ